MRYIKYLLGVTILLYGCTPVLTPSNIGGLTPEQILALQQQGHSVIGCIQAGGPPVGGAGSFLVIPNTAQGTVSFAPDCHPTTNVTLGAVGQSPTPTPVPAPKLGR